MHAEVACLRNCKQKKLIPQCVMLIVRIPDEEAPKACAAAVHGAAKEEAPGYMVSRPCSDCMCQIIKSKVKQVIFTDPDPEGWGDYCQKNLPEAPRVHDQAERHIMKRRAMR